MTGPAVAERETELLVHFIGAGPGDPELLTLKGKRLIEQADLVIFADSLVNPAVCAFARPGARIEASSSLTLEMTMELVLEAARRGQHVARVHSGDPSVYGAINEQIAILEREGVGYEIVPGVSAAFAAAARLGVEMTVPNVSQTVILTRASGRASRVPQQEQLRELAAHGASMAIFLSASMMGQVVRELKAGGYAPGTPCCVVYKATWPDEQIIRGTLASIAQKVRAARFTRQAIIMVGPAFGDRSAERSRLYAPDYVHLFRHAT
ncbi:MAG: precorrin-4 C(11)-methyltransferase [Chloroflexota bacterium]|nr:precorrin-4 C(11)-methyltransferase [Chloroflexota bacterium]